jgi:hypothetical protein
LWLEKAKFVTVALTIAVRLEYRTIVNGNVPPALVLGRETSVNFVHVPPGPAATRRVFVGTVVPAFRTYPAGRTTV